MTPLDLLTEAKDRFVILYHKNETSLGLLLRQALAKYQEKAGSMGSVKIVADDEGEIDSPSNCLEVIMAVDANARYVESRVEDGKIKIDVVDIEGTSIGDTVFPVTVHYFHNLREWGMEDDLPNGTTSLLLDYLVALIDIPNTERERAVNASTDIQVDLPSKQELKERVLQIEQQMEESRAIGLPVAVY